MLLSLLLCVLIALLSANLLRVIHERDLARGEARLWKDIAMTDEQGSPWEPELPLVRSPRRPPQQQSMYFTDDFPNL